MASFQPGTFSSHNKGRRGEEKLGRIVPFHLAKTRGPLIYRSLLLPIHRAALPSFSSSRKKKRRLITRKGESSKKIPPRSYFNHFVRGGEGEKSCNNNRKSGLLRHKGAMFIMKPPPPPSFENFYFSTGVKLPAETALGSL